MNSSLIKKEKEISTLKQNLASVREEITDFITNLKYKYLYYNINKIVRG